MRQTWYTWSNAHNTIAYRYGPYLTLRAAVVSLCRQFHDKRKRPRLDCRGPGAWMYTPPRSVGRGRHPIAIYQPDAAQLCEVPRREVQFMLPLDGDAPIFFVTDEDLRIRRKRRPCTGSASATA